MPSSSYRAVEAGVETSERRRSLLKAAPRRPEPRRRWVRPARRRGVQSSGDAPMGAYPDFGLRFRLTVMQRQRSASGLPFLGIT